MTVLLVAAAGGHLTELHHLVHRIPGGDDRVWVTWESAQSTSLLEGEEVVCVDFPSPRDLSTTGRNTRVAGQVLAQRRFDAVYSTGSSVALSFLPLAAARGLPATYVESATRVTSPSTTGRLLAGVPAVRCYAQAARWAGRRWRFAGSVFDDYRAVLYPAGEVRSVVVTVGGSDYGFRRLLDRMAAVLPPDLDVLWQTGPTELPPSRRAHPHVPWRELVHAMGAADVVVSHAGIGSTLDILDAGRCPVLVPRLRSKGEHIDDHQAEVVRSLADRGLAVVPDGGVVRWEHLVQAARTRIVRAPSPGAVPL